MYRSSRDTQRQSRGHRDEVARLAFFMHILIDMRGESAKENKFYSDYPEARRKVPLKGRMATLVTATCMARKQSSICIPIELHCNTQRAKGHTEVEAQDLSQADIDGRCTCRAQCYM